MHGRLAATRRMGDDVDSAADAGGAYGAACEVLAHSAIGQSALTPGALTYASYSTGRLHCENRFVPLPRRSLKSALVSGSTVPPPCLS